MTSVFLEICSLIGCLMLFVVGVKTHALSEAGEEPKDGSYKISGQMFCDIAFFGGLLLSLVFLHAAGSGWMTSGFYVTGAAAVVCILNWVVAFNVSSPTEFYWQHSRVMMISSNAGFIAASVLLFL